MTRPSHFLNSSCLKGKVPTKTSTQSLQDQLLETRLRIERAKLVKIEAEIPDKNPKYTRYEDMPPPTPEDEARFYARFRELIAGIDDAQIEANLDRFRGPDQAAARKVLLAGRAEIASVYDVTL